VTIPGHNMGEDLIRYAQSRNVTELIIGKSRRSRWSEIWRGLVVHQVIRKSGNIDVYVISGEDEPAQGVQGVVPSRRSLRQLNAYLGKKCSCSARSLKATWAICAQKSITP
jgi:K+-sensing histidine kinase KdpD